MSDGYIQTNSEFMKKMRELLGETPEVKDLPGKEAERQKADLESELYAIRRRQQYAEASKNQ